MSERNRSTDTATDVDAAAPAALAAGGRADVNAMIARLYREMRGIARRHLRGQRKHLTLGTTALVNEAYMRLVDYTRMQWQDRAHFFAVSAQVMRRILIEHARRHNLKRGGGVAHVSLQEAASVGGNRAGDLVALDATCARIMRALFAEIGNHWFPGSSTEASKVRAPATSSSCKHAAASSRSPRSRRDAFDRQTSAQEATSHGRPSRSSRPAANAAAAERTSASSASFAAISNQSSASASRKRSR
jgi:hypothetical protein